MLFGTPAGGASSKRAALLQPSVGGKRKVYQFGIGGKTPKCGGCITCLKTSKKKACLTNRAQLEKGLEPIFMTEAARRKAGGAIGESSASEDDVS